MLQVHRKTDDVTLEKHGQKVKEKQPARVSMSVEGLTRTVFREQSEPS